MHALPFQLPHGGMYFSIRMGQSTDLNRTARRASDVLVIEFNTDPRDVPEPDGLSADAGFRSIVTPKANSVLFQ